MSLYEMQRLIHDLNVQPALVERFRAAPDVVLDEYALDEAERAALRDGDLAALWRLGLHPLMMLHYARLRQIRMPDLYAQIGPLKGERHLVSARGASKA